MQKLMPTLILTILIYACSPVHKIEKTTSTKEKSPIVHEDTYSKTRKILIQEAQKQLGSNYKYGGITPKGFDCSGFTSFVYDKIAITLPRSSAAQAQKGVKITQGAARPGDLLFFKLSPKGKISHVAMVLSNDEKGMEIIHSTTSKGVIKENISRSKYWQEKLLYGRRYIEE